MQSRKQENSSNEFIDFFLDKARFFTFITGFIPTFYQVKILNDESKFISIRASRQSGKTEVIAVRVLHDCLLKNNFKVLILAPTQRQASIVYQKIQSYFLHHSYLNQLVVRNTLNYLLLDNGSEIYCLPGANADTIRGYSPNLIVVDEAAFVKESVYTALEPSLAATGGGLILISTPFGKKGRFYEACNSRFYSSYHIPFSKCNFLDKTFIEKQKEDLTDIEFKQEYEAEFIELADNFFSVNEVKECIADIESEEQALPDWEYFLGVDQARHGNDESVYVVSKKKEGMPWMIVKIEATQKKPLTDVIGRVQALHEKFGFKKVFIDSTGLGAGSFDVLKEKGLPVEEIVFTQKTKQELYQNLKKLIETKNVLLPDNKKLLYQLLELVFEYSSNGFLSISHPDSVNAHDDYPDALALSLASELTKSKTIILNDDGLIF